MNVWVVEHDDLMYDMGDKYLRGVFASEEDARIAQKAITPANPGSPSILHDPHCCEITEYEVEGTI